MIDRNSHELSLVGVRAMDDGREQELDSHGLIAFYGASLESCGCSAGLIGDKHGGQLVIVSVSNNGPNKQ